MFGVMHHLSSHLNAHLGTPKTSLRATDGASLAAASHPSPRGAQRLSPSAFGAPARARDALPLHRRRLGGLLRAKGLSATEPDGSGLRTLHAPYGAQRLKDLRLEGQEDAGGLGGEPETGAGGRAGALPGALWAVWILRCIDFPFRTAGLRVVFHLSPWFQAVSGAPKGCRVRGAAACGPRTASVRPRRH